MKPVCPHEKALGDYLEGRLPAVERDAFECHLADCDRCLQEVHLVHGLVRGTTTDRTRPVPTAVTRRAVRRVDRLIAGRRPRRRPIATRFQEWFGRMRNQLMPGMSPGPQLAPIRGSKHFVDRGLVEVKKTFKTIDTLIEIEKTGQRQACIRVKITPARTEDADIRVTLVKNGQREISSFLLENQQAAFEAIPFDRYTLEFLRNGVKIGAYAFEIKETPNGRGQQR